MYCAKKYCKIQHFADDTNPKPASITTINKQTNHDLKNLSNWRNANKIVHNVNKTELVMLSPPKKQLNDGLKVKLNGKKLYQTDQSNI